MNSVRDYLLSLLQRNSGTSGQYEISSCPQLIERIQQLGFLPLLDSGIDGYCAEEMMAPEYHYITFDDGSWEWPLWTWKGPAITEGNCVYGKFFGGKAAQTLAETLHCVLPKVGESVETSFSGRPIRFWRMPSSSRAYPLSLDKKAAAYRRMFETICLL